ncbi:MAG: hypothetical protein GY720_06605 [bacterium]|nr:hypothetical protein [bacterium]
MAWALDRIRPPWDESRPAIFDFLLERFNSDGSLGTEPPDLPDVVLEPETVVFGPGTRDGISRHFGTDFASSDVVAAVVGAVTKLARRSTSARAAALYSLVSEEGTLGFVDGALGFIANNNLDPDRLRAIGRWLATQAPDRSSVKFGIALIGLVDPLDVDTVLTLGAHDEFTLYSAVAASNSSGGERTLFQLAKRVHGWGRIQTVERLADTEDPEIQRWMLTEGYQNSIMYEYLAMTCAQTGRLADALAADEIDDDLTTAAGEILAAIVIGQPGPQPSEYPDLVPAIEDYLRHVGHRRGTLHDHVSVSGIRRFLDEPVSVEIAEPLLETLRTDADEFLSRDHFPGEATAGLLNPDGVAYSEALTTAGELGIDAYDALYERIEQSLDERPAWFELLRATDEGRLERTLELGRAKIDLAAIPTGPSNAIGLAAGFEPHGELLSFLQELARFPGHGWDLISVGLRSPTVQNRNTAIRALQNWPREVWPDDAAAALEAMIATEVRDDVRTFAGDVLLGDVPIDESWGRTITKLAERSPKLADLARDLAATPPGRRLRSTAGFGDFAMWDGPYDSEPWDQARVFVSGLDAEFNVTYSEGRLNSNKERHENLTRQEAGSRALPLMNRLLVG